MLWLVWLQIGPILGSGGQVASDLRLWSGKNGQVWVGYRAHRKGKTDLYLHHLDTSGTSLVPYSGWCLTVGEGSDVQLWDGLVGLDGRFYGAASLGEKVLLFSLSSSGLWAWRHEQRLDYKPTELRVLASSAEGLLLGILSDTRLEVQIWTKTGEKVGLWQASDSITSKRHLRFLPGNSEGFWVLWEGFSQNNWQVFVQKLSWQGGPLASFQVLSGLPHTIYQANYLEDGYGGFFAVYESSDLQSSGKDLYLVRYNRAAQKVYEVPLCLEVGDQQNPRLYKRGTELLVVWEDNRRQDWDIYYQRLDIATGKPLLASAGKALVELPGPQLNPHLVLDYFQNEAVVVWEDKRRLKPDLYFQRISAEGKPLWAFEGQGLVVAPYAQHHLCVAAQDFRTFWVAYLEDEPLRGTHPSLLCVTTDGEIKKALPLRGSDHAIVPLQGLFVYPWGDKLALFWQDERDFAKRPQLYGQALDAEGKPLWPREGLSVALQPHATQKLADVYSLRDTLWVLWYSEESDVEADLYAQAFTTSGERLFGAKGFPICVADRVQSEAKWLYQQGVLYATWTDSRSLEQTGFDLYYRPVWPASPEVGWRTSGPFQNTAYYAPIDSTTLHHFWSEAPNGRTYQIYAGHGPLGRPSNPHPLRASSKPQRFPAYLAIPSGEALAAFCEEAPDAYHQAVVLMLLSAQGSLVWNLPKALSATHSLYPHLTPLTGDRILLTGLSSSAPGSWSLQYAEYDWRTGAKLSEGTLLAPVPERIRWQIVSEQKGLWVLLQMPTGWVLYQGVLGKALRPYPLPARPKEAQLLQWLGRTYLVWISGEQIQWTVLTPLP